MKQSGIGRPPKIKDVLTLARLTVEAGRYGYSIHGKERLDQRIVKLGLVEPDVAYVIKHGHREEKRDAWSEIHQSWVYAVRGRTKDRVELRVCFALESMPDGHWAVIITIINLNL
jgi:hypothetical protein